VMMKENDAHIKFAFLTGISKFSKANIFSGLNNLTDISLKPKYATICGYTQRDLDTRFAPYLEGADMDRIQEWYNGYNFLGERVYNPFDILQFIDNDLVFKNYWWSSGNPYFLITLLKQHPYNLPDLQNIPVGEELLNTFEIEKLRLEVLLFQSGYLTIRSYVSDPDFGSNDYTLKVPNKEVSISLNRLFLDYLTDDKIRASREITQAVSNADFERMRSIFIALFASIPYTHYVKNTIGEYEGYYASVFFAYLSASGFSIIAEDVTNSGRIDLTLLLRDQIYILEFKVLDTPRTDPSAPNTALEQIKTKAYAQKYQDTGKPIYLVGIEFDATQRNIASFAWEEA